MLAVKLFDAIHPILSGEEDAIISKNFAHFFSMTFKFEGFTDEEIHNRLNLEARKKYKQ